MLGKIIQTLKLPDGTLKILVEALNKVKINKVIENNGFFQAVTEPINDITKDNVETKALMKSLVNEFQEYSKYNPRINHEIFGILDDIHDASHLSDIIAANIGISLEKKQELLEINDVQSKLRKMLFEMEYEITLLKSEINIRESVKKQMEKTQKDYFLNEQLKSNS